MPRDEPIAILLTAVAVSRAAGTAILGRARCKRRTARPQTSKPATIAARTRGRDKPPIKPARYRHPHDGDESEYVRVRRDPGEPAEVDEPISEHRTEFEPRLQVGEGDEGIDADAEQ